jgi:uncharacterized membrane protein
MAETISAEAMDEPFFRALLTPHRSLGRKGFAILMGALLFGWLAVGAFTLSHGAWPIFGFFGLDVLLVYVAFRVNYRAARASEEVAISHTRLDITKVAPSGRRDHHAFNPRWTRFAVSRHDEIGITGMAVEQRDESVSIGSFLNPDDRESFAAAFSSALAKARGR